MVHKITTCDPQPSPSGGILVMVTGDPSTATSQRRSFAQMFHLMPDGASWYIHNDIFRLNSG